MIADKAFCHIDVVELGYYCIKFNGAGTMVQWFCAGSQVQIPGIAVGSNPLPVVAKCL